MLRFFLILIISIMISGSAFGNRTKVLIIHSYHQGLEWTDNVTKGLYKAFEPMEDSVELFFEYLDTKRFLTPDYLDELDTFYGIKLQQMQFNLVIACDNDALNFVLENRDTYFKNAPLVFCGINNYNSPIIKGQTNLTGVIEYPDFKATLNLIRQFHPNVNRLIIINDNKTTTAIANKSLLTAIEPEYSSAFEFVYWENMLYDEIKDNLDNLNKNDAVLLLTYNQDKNGRFISFRENRELIPDNFNLPVYCTWMFFMDENIIGGKVISGEDQGLRAGKRAIQIIRGVKAGDIPVDTSSLSQYIFSYPMLKKFQISVKDLPENATVIDEPKSFYSVNKKLIIGIISVLGLAILIILVLANAIFRRRRAEKELLVKQRHLKENLQFQKLMSDIVALLNSTNDFTSVTGSILQKITSHYNIGKVALYNFNEEESIARIISSNIADVSPGISELNPDDFHKLNRIIDILRNEHFISDDLSNMTPEERAFYEEREIRAISIFPIKIGKRIFGMAGFAQSRHYAWPEKTLYELETIVRMIANAWERNNQMNKHLLVKEKNLKATVLVEKSARMASIGVMASGITHEINQPLNALKITVDSLHYWDKRNEGAMPEIVKGKLTTLSSGIQRIDQIIKHMRNFWIAPSNTAQAEKVDLVKATKKSFSLVAQQMKEHDISAELNLPNNKLWLHANYIQIEQIIINLVVNAIQALGKKEKGQKRIVVTIIEENQFVLIKISDNANGISTDLGDKIFDPFYSTKQTDQGTGLGLAIVKTFVDRLNGSIVYDNNEEGGVTFTVRLHKTN